VFSERGLGRELRDLGLDDGDYAAICNKG
jgi:hypothetical protein